MELRRVFSYVFIAAIAIIFTISFGPASNCTGGEADLNRPAAVVNGKDISVEEFNRAYGQQLAQMRSMGGQLPESLLRQWVPQQVIQGLVDNELMVQAAEKRGITASNEEVARLIHSNPDFHGENGQFDEATYRRVLQNFYRRSFSDYERWVRRQLSAQKMREFIESTAIVSDEEVRFRYQRDGNTAEVTYVKFQPSFYASTVGEPTAKEIADYTAANEAAIAADYEKNKLAYTQGEQVQARHILLKVAPESSADKKAAVKSRIEALKKAVDDGQDFAELARANSEDEGSKQSGGDLGFNEKQNWVTPFAEAAFKLDEGKVSDPVETQFGYHLIKVEAKKPAQTQSLDEVRGDIAKKLAKDSKLQTLAKAAAQKALTDAKNKKSLTELFPAPKNDNPSGFRAPETKPEAVTTESFSASTDSVPRLGLAPELAKAIFARNEKGLLDQVFEVPGGGYVVAVVNSRTLPTDADFETRKVQLKDAALSAKRNELTTGFLKTLKTEGKVETNEDVIANVLGQS